MHRRRFIPALRRRRGFWHEQSCVSNRTLQYRGQYFPSDWLVSRRTDNTWPPYSPDQSPPDYILWDYLKERVYEDNPDTIDRLKENIKWEIRRIPNDMLERVVNKFNVWRTTSSSLIRHVINYWSQWLNVHQFKNAFDCKTLKYFPPIVKKSLKNSYSCRNCNKFILSEILCPTL